IGEAPLIFGMYALAKRRQRRRDFAGSIAQLSIQLLCPAHLAGLGVVGPRSDIPGFLRHFEPLVDLVQGALRALAFGYIAMNDRDTHHVSAWIPDRAGADPNLDQASVFAPPGRLEINLLALKDA